MASPEYKLTYFNFKGRAEIIRYIFAIADVDYIDERFEKEDWPKYKALAPFGQAPFITFEEHTYAQTFAITNYLARKYDLLGATPLEELKVNMIVECVRDIFAALYANFYETDQTKKASYIEKFYNDQLPPFFDYIQKFLDENKEPGGFFVGKSITVADLVVFNLYETIESFNKGDELQKYPKLVKFSHHIAAHPKIAAWIAKRPKTSM